jgi:tRNA dimethylallyltransferase
VTAVLLPEGVPAVGPDELLVIVGETASGKTRLALELARRHGGELIGADSVQVYRGFDVGSGKPTADELAGVRHHMLDVADPDEPFDAGRFVALADEAIADVRARGATPIVCGGTFLWVRALVHGLADAPQAPAAIRDRLQREVVEVGAPALHARLATIDPATAARLHPNDAVRITRALEVFEATGRTMSSIQQAHGFRAIRHRARLVAIRHARAEIEARIARRAEAMLAAGWIDEVQRLVAAGYGTSKPMRAVGYAEVHAFVTGRLAEAELLPSIVRTTRIFARRQRTWLAKADVTWIDADVVERFLASS